MIDSRDLGKMASGSSGFGVKSGHGTFLDKQDRSISFCSMSKFDPLCVFDLIFTHTVVSLAEIQAEGQSRNFTQIYRDS